MQGVSDESVEPAPRHTPALGPAVDALLERAAAVCTRVVAAVLLALVVLALVSVVSTSVHALKHGTPGLAAIEGLDGAFLVIILLEVVHTTLARGPIAQRVREFVVVGLTVSIRTGLELAADVTKERQTVAVNLAITSAGVLALVIALWVTRKLTAHGTTASRPSPRARSDQAP